MNELTTGETLETKLKFPPFIPHGRGLSQGIQPTTCRIARPSTLVYLQIIVRVSQKEVTENE